LIDALPEEVERVKQILRDEMANAVKLNVPLIIDVKTGSNWYESK